MIFTGKYVNVPLTDINQNRFALTCCNVSLTEVACALNCVNAFYSISGRCVNGVYYVNDMLTVFMCLYHVCVNHVIIALTIR